MEWRRGAGPLEYDAEKLELLEDKLLWSEEQRIELLGLLPENVDAAERIWGVQGPQDDADVHSVPPYRRTAVPPYRHAAVPLGTRRPL